MGDWAIQRGQTTIGAGNATVTLTAGTDYTAPASASAAFLRVTSTTRTAVATDSPQNTGAWVTYATDITDDVTLNRHGTSGAVTVEWEILEYTGAGAGGNEAIVRHVEAVALGTSDTAGSTGAVSGVVTDADVAVFVTGQGSDSSANNGYNTALHTAAWDSGSQIATMTRGTSGAVVSTVSVAVVEFTGSAWTVERAEHTYSSAGTTETETISDVGSVAKAMLHAQLRTSNNGLDEFGHNVWVTGTTEVSFELISGANVSHVGVAWVMSNSQSGGTTDMSVERVSGTGSASSFTDSFSAVTLAEAALMGETAWSSGTGSSGYRAIVGMRLTDTTEVTITRPDSSNTITYRLEVVTLPTAGGGGGGDPTAAGGINRGLIGGGLIGHSLIG